MKIGVYNIINDPIPKLNLIKEINVNKSDFEYDEKIIKLLNKHLMLDKLDSENAYALSLTYGLIPRGIIHLGTGNNEKTITNIRGLGIGLLLTGAEQFMCFHNHPGGNKRISKADNMLTEKNDELGDCIGVHFIRHIMVTKNFWKAC